MEVYCSRRRPALISPSCGMPRPVSKVTGSPSFESSMACRIFLAFLSPKPGNDRTCSQRQCVNNNGITKYDVDAHKMSVHNRNTLLKSLGCLKSWHASCQNLLQDCYCISVQVGLFRRTYDHEQRMHEQRTHNHELRNKLHNDKSAETTVLLHKQLKSFENAVLLH